MPNEPLFTPVRVGAQTLPNRALMAPLTRNRAHPDGTPWDHAQVYYGQRASAGLIISEATQVSDMGKGYKDTPGIYTDAHVAAWRKITDAVHAQGGRIYCQLWHVGRISHISLLPEGRRPVAPSAIRAEVQTFTENGFEDCSQPEELSQEGIAKTIDDFRNAARKAKAAGFDGVEVHSANGYLLDQFIQSKTNKRGDRYGGEAAWRARFTAEVIEAVAEVWPRNRIGVRLSPLGEANDIGDDDPEATFRVVYQRLNNMGLAYLHVVEKFYTADSDEENRGILRRLRREWDGPYIANGGYDADAATTAVRESHADAIAFGRPFIANPDLPERMRTGAAMNEPNHDTFYGGDETGYTDYPFLDGVRAL